LCKQTNDILGDHASCSAKTSDIVIRHNRVRNLLDKICSEGLLAPVMEKKGILGPTPFRRSGDVTIPLWTGGKGLAIDVAVTCPFNSHNLTRADPCEHYAEYQKHRKYDGDFKGAAYSFAAMVFETTGGVNAEGMSVLRQVFRFAARQEGVKLPVYAGRAWARLSCNLQTSVAQAILNRMPGVTVGGEPDISDFAGDPKLVPIDALIPIDAVSAGHNCPLTVYPNRSSVNDKELGPVDWRVSDFAKSDSVRQCGLDLSLSCPLSPPKSRATRNCAHPLDIDIDIHTLNEQGDEDSC